MLKSTAKARKASEKPDDFVSGETATLAAGTPSGFSVIEEEVAQFSRLAEKWWDVTGEFAPLHRFNPTRVRFIRDEALRAFGRDHRSLKPFEGLKLIDVGCGGGLLSEPMRRMGFDVTGLDASAQNIGTARAHADISGLEITYVADTVENLSAHFTGGYDVVLCMEVIEHVADPEAFLKVCASLVKPGGLLITATLSRTLKAFALAIVGAEYVLGWVPKGTHDWQKFLKPSEIAGFLMGTGLELEAPVGVSYDPLNDVWALSGETDVNYMLVARRV
jgi:2-polyprenyl-6-hydroxyphenyl methylase / 3-demethylubiquinone-9 3-methyltransferase